MGRLICIALCLLVGPLARAELTVYMRESTVSLDTPFQIEVRAKGSSVGQVEVPFSDDVFVSETPMGRQSNYSIQVVNGKQSRVSELVLVYRAKARRAGDITIPPFKAMVDGKEVESEPLALKVRTTPNVPESSPQGTESRGGASDKKVLTLDDAVFAESRVDKQSVYLGEAVELTVALNRLDSYGVQVIWSTRGYTPPLAEGFFATQSREVNERIERDGIKYIARQFVQDLYPTQTGTLSIGAWQWHGAVRGITNAGRQSIEKDLHTAPIEIEVKPLPEAPANYSGTVGEFSFYVDFDSAGADQGRIELEQGRPVLMRLTLAGKGNEHAIKAPVLPDIPWAQVADPKPSTDVDPEGGQITRRFVYAFTALEAGEFTLPTLSYCYFSPAADEYVTRTVDSLKVSVAPSKERTNLVVVGGMDDALQQEVEVVVNELHPILLQSALLRETKSSPLLPVTLAGAPLVAYGVLALALRRRRRLAGDTGLARAYKARSKSEKRVAAALASENPAEALFKAMVGYLADHCNVVEAGLTSQDARTLMLAQGVSADLTMLVHRMLKSCERSQYGGTVLSPAELEALGDGALEVLDQLEAYFKKRGK